MANDERIEILSPKINNVTLLVRGDSSLICNRLSSEVMQTIKQPGKDNKKIVAKLGGTYVTDDEEYERSRYFTRSNKNGFPLNAFKKAVIAVAKGKGWWSGTNITGKLLNASFQLIEENDDPCVEIIGEIKRREDIGRRPAKKTPAMIRRYEYQSGWECKFRAKYNANLISLQSLIGLIDTAGYGIGVGDWRPELDGNHGMFKIVGSYDEKGNWIAIT